MIVIRRDFPEGSETSESYPRAYQSSWLHKTQRYPYSVPKSLYLQKPSSRNIKSHLQVNVKNLTNSHKSNFVNLPKLTTKNNDYNIFPNSPNEKNVIEQSLPKLVPTTNSNDKSIEKNQNPDNLKKDVQIIEKEDIIEDDSNRFYCQKCHKIFNPKSCSNDFVQIIPNFFLCMNHYKEYDGTKNFPIDLQKLLRKYFIDNFVNIVFSPPPCHFDSVPIHQPYDIFFPTITFHCNSDIEDVCWEELNEKLGENVFIYNIERGSTICSAAVIYDIKWNDFQMLSSDLKKKFLPIFNEVKSKFQPAIKESLIGNYVEKPKITIPDLAKINNFVKSKSKNILQNFSELDQFEFDTIIKNLINFTQDQKSKKHYKKILENIQDYENAEKQIHSDIENNPFEMTVVSSSIIVNKYIDDYNKLKSTLSESQIEEYCLYHGTNVVNQIGIINSAFNLPNENYEIESRDSGWYGSGIYATENLFYAALYSGKNSLHLRINDTASVLMCKCFKNKEQVKEITKKCSGEEMDWEFVNNFGINHVIVGSNNKYNPIKIEDRNKHLVVAEEFVFGNKCQIIPLFSFQVMRRDYFILWKDDNIENLENTRYMKKLLKQEYNIYGAKNNDEALEIIRLKKRNKMKLITNGGFDLKGKELIETLRKDFHYNFICLVFARTLDHLKWVKKIENVILTNNNDKFQEFISLEMTHDEIMRYVHELEELHDTKFNINEKEILHFPDFVEDIDNEISRNKHF